MGIGLRVNQPHIDPHLISLLFARYPQECSPRQAALRSRGDWQVCSHIASWKCARLLLNPQSWISGSESRPEYRRQSTRSLCLRCDFQTAALQCFSQARHSKPHFRLVIDMREKSVDMPKTTSGCDCESGARASHAACFWGATLQARC